MFDLSTKGKTKDKKEKKPEAAKYQTTQHGSS
jgi:hypothetical protein